MKFIFLCSLGLLLLSSCSDVATPTISSIKINKIWIEEYPVSSGPNSWDDPLIGVTSGPDVLWKITGPQSIESTSYKLDVSGDTLLFSGGGLPVLLESPKSTYTLTLWDLDDIDLTDIGSSNDLMASIDFAPYVSGESGTKVYQYSNNSLVISMELTYLFE